MTCLPFYVSIFMIYASFISLIDSFHLLSQVVAAVHEAHTRGIVLRDLKLRKFVFSDESR